MKKINNYCSSSRNMAQVLYVVLVVFVIVVVLVLFSSFSVLHF